MRWMAPSDATDSDDVADADSSSASELEQPCHRMTVAGNSIPMTAPHVSALHSNNPFISHNHAVAFSGAAAAAAAPTAITTGNVPRRILPANFSGRGEDVKIEPALQPHVHVGGRCAHVCVDAALDDPDCESDCGTEPLAEAAGAAAGVPSAAERLNEAIEELHRALEDTRLPRRSQKKFTVRDWLL